MGALTMGNDGHVTDVGGLVHERPDLIWNCEPTRSASMLSSTAVIKGPTDCEVTANVDEVIGSQSALQSLRVGDEELEDLHHGD